MASLASIPPHAARLLPPCLNLTGSTAYCTVSYHLKLLLIVLFLSFLAWISPAALLIVLFKTVPSI
jgi:hypothetical protein